jgi:hypothetical protein
VTSLGPLVVCAAFCLETGARIFAIHSCRTFRAKSEDIYPILESVAYAPNTVRRTEVVARQNIQD